MAMLIPSSENIVLYEYEYGGDDVFMASNNVQQVNMVQRK